MPFAQNKSASWKHSSADRGAVVTNKLESRRTSLSVSAKAQE